MTAVGCDGEATWVSSQAGIIASVDSSSGNSLPYVLIAGKLFYGGRRMPDLENLDINSAAVIPFNQLPTLIPGLKRLRDRWEIELPQENAEFWEFVSIPQHEGQLISDSVLHYRPSLRMAFNRTSSGPNLTMFISEKAYSFLWIIQERSDLDCLIERLEKASALLR